MFVLTNPSELAGCDARSIFKWSLTDFNLGFSSSMINWHTNVKDPSLSNYLSRAGGRIVECIPFPRVCIYPTPPHEQDVTVIFLKESLTEFFL